MICPSWLESRRSKAARSSWSSFLRANRSCRVAAAGRRRAAPVGGAGSGRHEIGAPTHPRRLRGLHPALRTEEPSVKVVGSAAVPSRRWNCVVWSWEGLENAPAKPHRSFACSHWESHGALPPPACCPPALPASLLPPSPCRALKTPYTLSASCTAGHMTGMCRLASSRRPASTFSGSTVNGSASGGTSCRR